MAPIVSKDEMDLFNLGLFEFLYEELDDHSYINPVAHYGYMITEILKILRNHEW